MVLAFSEGFGSALGKGAGAIAAYTALGLYFIVRYISKSQNHCASLTAMTASIMGTFVLMFVARSAFASSASVCAVFAFARRIMPPSLR